MKSVKRTTEKSIDLAATIPAVRFTDYDPSTPHPSSKLLGYYHSSATRTATTFCAKLVLRKNGNDVCFLTVQKSQGPLKPS
jgi:hypothetical protein